jgi:predicted HicB family RNase H-like nuclease
MPDSTTRTTRFTIRLPNELLAELERQAAAREVSVATVILERLELGAVRRSE